MNICEQILGDMRSRIEKLELSESSLLEKAGVNHSTWYRWHKGETTPTLGALMKIDAAIKEAEHDQAHSGH